MREKKKLSTLGEGGRRRSRTMAKEDSKEESNQFSGTPTVSLPVLSLSFFSPARFLTIGFQIERHPVGNRTGKHMSLPE